jgi:hypothetical protein
MFAGSQASVLQVCHDEDFHVYSENLGFNSEGLWWGFLAGRTQALTGTSGWRRPLLQFSGQRR